MPDRVLTIFAHPDDAECTVGGSLLSWADAGAEIFMCLITDGDKGTNDSTESAASVIARRCREQAAAAAQLGAHVISLGYEDGMLEPTLALRRELVRLVRQVRPNRVITNDPSLWFRRDLYLNHPDHRAAGQAVVEALYPAVKKPNIFPELLAGGLEPHVVEELWLGPTDHPNRWVDISATIDRKIDLICTHASQFPREYTEPAFRHMAQSEGRARGLAYAEAFRVVRLVRQTVRAFAEADA